MVLPVVGDGAHDVPAEPGGIHHRAYANTHTHQRPKPPERHIVYSPVRWAVPYAHAIDPP